MAIVKINDIYDTSYTHRWIEDVERIQRVLLENGYNSLLKDCGDLWENYSDDFASGWMNLPEEDEDLWNILEVLI